MEAETLEALKGSIAKWEGVVAGTRSDDGPRDCPLCTLFNKPPDRCYGCPVRERAEQSFCDNTPYVAWEEACEDEGSDGDANTPALKALAQAELDFLKSLLPSNVLPSEER